MSNFHTDSCIQDSPVSIRKAFLDPDHDGGVSLPLMPSNHGNSNSRGHSQPQQPDIDCSEGPGLCAHMLTLISVLLILVSLPLSLMFVVKVVQEYERAVIFRLGRLLSGGARGPGVFFIIPCVDIYEKIDMRTQTFDVPPQEVREKRYF